MRQLFKVFYENGKEENINEYIGLGWKVVSFTTTFSIHNNMYICVLFQKPD